MNQPINIKISLKEHVISNLLLFLSKGVKIAFTPNCTVRDLLLRQLGFDQNYITQRIQTIFLNGKAVDDISSTMVSDKSTLALSAAMPGLAGAVFRAKSRYAVMRNSISYSSPEKPVPAGSGVLELKLFNLVGREIGEIILHRGVLIHWNELLSLKEEYPYLFDSNKSSLFVNGKKTDIDSLISSKMEIREILLRIHVNKP